jgi:hypothetical protein
LQENPDGSIKDDYNDPAKKSRRTVSMDVSSAAFIPKKKPSSIKK